MKRISSFVERNKSWILVFFSVLYFLAVFLMAHRKTFWNDELYTYHFSQLSTWSDLWQALSTGADQIPPSFVLLSKLSTNLLGIHHISLRLPETIGFFVMLLCLYRIVSHRMSAVCGFIAMLFPLVTGAFDYAYEARPYGLVLGFDALAFLCWTAIAEGKNRKLLLPGLVICLCGAWMSHYYGLLILFPLTIGEIVRTRSTRRIDASVWAAFALAVAPIVLFLPLFRGAMAYAPTFWAKVRWNDIFRSYDFLLKPAALTLASMWVFSAILSGSFSVEKTDSTRPFRSYELAAILGFLVSPIVAVVGAKVVTGAFTERHSLQVIIGFSLLLPLAVHYVLVPRKLAVVALACILLGFAHEATSKYSQWTVDSNALADSIDFLKNNTGKDSPIACTYSHNALRLWYYGPADLKDRIFYAADPEASVRIVHHDTIDRGLLDLKPWFPQTNVIPYETFVRTYPTFFLYHNSSDQDWRWDWIVSSLLMDQRFVELKAREGNQLLFLVTSR